VARPTTSSRLAARRLASAVALLGALAGALGCAAAPPRKMTFLEAGLLDPRPGPGSEQLLPSNGPAAAPLPTGERPASRPASPPRPPLAGPHPAPPVSDALPEAIPGDPVGGPSIDPVLVRFAAEARMRRFRAASGQGLPPATEAAWRGLVGQLDGYLARPLSQTPLLELVRASVTLDTEWDLDLRRHGPAPGGLARLVTDRARRISTRIAASRAIGNTMFASRPPGRLRWPIENAGLSSGFGPRDHPLDGTRQRHAGIDLAAEPGRVVNAATQGYVVSAGWSGGYGLLVEIRHAGDLTTRYGHLSALLCAPGDALEAGAPVGLVGRTGLSTGPHLHFEVWEGGQPRDPLAFIGGGSGLAGPATASFTSGGAR
jgi:hypothetical protein